MKTPSSFYATVKLLLYVCKAFGLVPFGYIRDKRRGTLKPKSRSSDMFRGIALSLWYFTNLVFDFYVPDFEVWDHPMKLNVVSYIFKISYHLASSTSIFFVSTFSRHSLPKILILISEVDQLLYEETERLVLYRKTRSFIILELVIISVTYIPLLCIHFISFPKTRPLTYFVKAVANIEYMSLLLIIVQFTNVILLLRQRYKYLNRWLDFHSNPWRDRNKWIYPLPDVKGLGLSYHNLKNERRKILERREIYSKLHDIVRLVNSHFGLPVFMLTFWLLMCVVFISYSCMFFIMSNISQGKELGEYAWILHGLIWCFFCIVLLFLITLSCHVTAEECDKSKILVEKWILRSGLDRETAMELRVLSMQLKNMKVAFTACGFFSLDLPFMYSFLGVIFTYIVVLAQFN